MDVDPPPPPPRPPRRKAKFTPKPPPPRKPKPPAVVQPKSETDIITDDQSVQDLIRRTDEYMAGRRGSRVQKKSAARVAFSHDVSASTSLSTHGKVKGTDDDQSDGLDLKDIGGQDTVPFDSTGGTEDLMESSSSAMASSSRRTKEYREPWDYHSTNYPITLPWRKPYSGNPDVLDEEEFGEAGKRSENDEDAINPAQELGLLEQNEEPRMLFMQLPRNLPMNRQTASLKGVAKEKDVTSSSSIPSRENGSNKGCSLEELPGGFMGKMLIYKSGAVKLKLGDNIFIVSPGMRHTFDQDVAAINTNSKDCCMLGKLEKKAIVTPDIDFFLDSMIDLS